jgi:amino acid adenylation domain-containing protein
MGHEPVLGTQPHQVHAAAPDWGLGDGPAAQVATEPLDRPGDPAGDPASWRVALAVTVDRYEGGTGGTAPIGNANDTVNGTAEPPAGAVLADLRGAPAPVDRPVAVGLLFDEDGTAAPFPLTVTVHRLPGGGVRLRAVHLRSHFSPAIAAQFLRHLAHVHSQVVLAPETSVADVSLLDGEELARTVALGRPASPLVTVATSLHAAFRRIAVLAPDAVAVCDGDRRLTYAELDEWSGRIASGLHAHGVRPGDRVGVCLARSAELVVTLLAVLKAGATYVPTDPAHPTDRQAHTARDAGLRLVVTTLAVVPGTRTVGPDELAEAATGTTSVDVPPDQAAYVIYTSGSTGRPKGVVVPHRNVVALVDATRDEYRLGPADAWSLFHSSAFDFSVFEMWGCLLTGARLVVVPHAVSRDPERFRDLLVAERVTVLCQTPSAFTQLVDVDHGAVATRLVVFGGEPLDARVLLPWFDRHPESACRMVNMFGITETTVHTTAQTVTRALAEAATRSVGPALPGWCLYVLDAAGRPVPPGVAGEIHVGGVGVAHGYLARPELTSARFPADPFTGGRMYRSGDLGRLRPDGRLDHLGRLDNQVKIRGFRIELDEIRSVLLDEPTVRAAAVVVNRDDPTDAATARIDAYVVLAGGAGTAGVRDRAARILPDYMVPATVTELPALPLTTNGKLDVAALPPPRMAGVGTVDGAAAGLREVWGAVFGAPVGPDDNFFELGGNSMYAVRLRTAMRARGMPEIPMRQLYRTPTPRQLAEALEHGGGSADDI